MRRRNFKEVKKIAKKNDVGFDPSTYDGIKGIYLSGMLADCQAVAREAKNFGFNFSIQGDRLFIH